MKDFASFLISEDWREDSKARQIATNALITVLSTLKDNEDSEGTNNALFIPRKIDGGVITSGVNLGLRGDAEKLLFVFGLKSLSDSGSLGFYNGQPMIVINCLRKPFDTKHLYQLIPHDIFVHEYIHYLDWVASHGKLQGQADTQAANKNWTELEAYVNNAAEFNGHYQQAIFKLQKKLFEMSASEVQILIRKGVKNFIDVVKTSYFPDYFIENLNSQFSKLLDDKLTNLFNGFIPEALAAIQSDERVAI